MSTRRCRSGHHMPTVTYVSCRLVHMREACAASCSCDLPLWLGLSRVCHCTSGDWAASTPPLRSRGGMRVHTKIAHALGLASNRFSPGHVGHFEVFPWTHRSAYSVRSPSLSRKSAPTKKKKCPEGVCCHARIFRRYIFVCIICLLIAWVPFHARVRRRPPHELHVKENEKH